MIDKETEIEGERDPEVDLQILDLLVVEVVKGIVAEALDLVLAPDR